MKVGWYKKIKALLIKENDTILKSVSEIHEKSECYDFCFPLIIISSTRPPKYECVTENYFSYFSTKRYVVGTQKNRLNETVCLSTQNTCLD